MQKNQRDLMVVLREANIEPEIMEAEMIWLHEVLNAVESIRNVAEVSEIHHISKYRVEKRNDRILKALKEKSEKPFYFIFNKN